MDHGKQPRLKPLLDKVPPGYLVDTRHLTAQGIDAKSIHDYVARGWLERVIRGVYRRPLPQGVEAPTTIPWVGVLLSLQRVLRYDLPLGGMSALRLEGYAHTLPLGGAPPVHVYGEAPSWLPRLPSDARFVVHGRRLFGEETLGIAEADGSAGRGDTASMVWHWPLRMSCPERALLEALDGLRDAAGFETLDKVFEGLTTLRPNRLMALLAASRSVKVRRLFFVFADRHGHAWRKYLDPGQLDLGAGPRALIPGGKLDPRYRIAVPKHFPLPSRSLFCVPKCIEPRILSLQERACTKRATAENCIISKVDRTFLDCKFEVSFCHW